MVARQQRSHGVLHLNPCLHDPAQTTKTSQRLPQVFFMQCGFGMLEAGSVTASATQHILLKNLLDTCISAVMWYSLGFGVAFDGTNPFIGVPSGNSTTLFGSYRMQADDAAGTANDGSAMGYNWGFWWFQFVRATRVACSVNGAPRLLDPVPRARRRRIDGLVMLACADLCSGGGDDRVRRCCGARAPHLVLGLLDADHADHLPRCRALGVEHRRISFRDERRRLPRRRRRLCRFGRCAPHRWHRRAMWCLRFVAMCAALTVGETDAVLTRRVSTLPPCRQSSARAPAASFVQLRLRKPPTAASRVANADRCVATSSGPCRCPGTRACCSRSAPSSSGWAGTASTQARPSPSTATRRTLSRVSLSRRHSQPRAGASLPCCSSAPAASGRSGTSLQCATASSAGAPTPPPGALRGTRRPT